MSVGHKLTTAAAFAMLFSGACGDPVVAPHDACADKFADIVGQARVVMTPPPADFLDDYYLARGDSMTLSASVRQVARVFDSDPENMMRPIELSAFGSCRIEWGSAVAAEISWTSSATAVATVDAGKIVTLTAGSSDISAHAVSLSLVETRRVYVLP